MNTTTQVLDRIQRESMEWRERNFPNTQEGSRNNSWKGMLEEVGELTHHDLKKDQKIRGTDEEHDKEMYDAVGDILVYFLGYCTYCDIKVGQTIAHTAPPQWPTPTADIALRRMVKELAEMGVMHADHPQLIGGYMHQRHVARFYKYLQSWCDLKGFADPSDIVQDVWAEVSKRDWTANSQDGSVA